MLAVLWNVLSFVSLSTSQLLANENFLNCSTLDDWSTDLEKIKNLIKSDDILRQSLIYRFNLIKQWIDLDDTWVIGTGNLLYKRNGEETSNQHFNETDYRLTDTLRFFASFRAFNPLGKINSSINCQTKYDYLLYAHLSEISFQPIMPLRLKAGTPIMLKCPICSIETKNIKWSILNQCTDEPNFNGRQELFHPSAFSLHNIASKNKKISKFDHFQAIWIEWLAIKERLQTFLKDTVGNKNVFCRKSSYPVSLTAASIDTSIFLYQKHLYFRAITPFHSGKYICQMNNVTEQYENIITNGYYTSDALSTNITLKSLNTCHKLTKIKKINSTEIIRETLLPSVIYLINVVEDPEDGDTILLLEDDHGRLTTNLTSRSIIKTFLSNVLKRVKHIKVKNMVGIIKSPSIWTRPLNDTRYCLQFLVHWSSWSSCEECQSSIGTRQRTGDCRVIPYNTWKNNCKVNLGSDEFNEQFFSHLRVYGFYMGFPTSGVPCQHETTGLSTICVQHKIDPTMRYLHMQKCTVGCGIATSIDLHPHAQHYADPEGRKYVHINSNILDAKGNYRNISKHASSSSTVSLSRTVTLICSSLSSRLTKINWKRDKWSLTEMVNLKQGTNFGMGNLPKTGTRFRIDRSQRLTLYKVQYDDEGVYQCLSNGKLLSLVKLFVIVPVPSYERQTAYIAAVTYQPTIAFILINLSIFILISSYKIWKFLKAKRFLLKKRKRKRVNL